MHTYIGRNGTIFNFSSSMEGDLIIRVPKKEVIHQVLIDHAKELRSEYYAESSVEGWAYIIMNNLYEEDSDDDMWDKIRCYLRDVPEAYDEVTLPCKDVIELVACEYVQPRKIKFLEEATPDQLLGI